MDGFVDGLHPDARIYHCRQIPLTVVVCNAIPSAGQCIGAGFAPTAVGMGVVPPSRGAVGPAVPVPTGGGIAPRLQDPSDLDSLGVTQLTVEREGGCKFSNRSRGMGLEVMARVF